MYRGCCTCHRERADVLAEIRGNRAACVRSQGAARVDVCGWIARRYCSCLSLLRAAPFFAPISFLSLRFVLLYSLKIFPIFAPFFLVFLLRTSFIFLFIPFCITSHYFSSILFPSLHFIPLYSLNFFPFFIFLVPFVFVSFQPPLFSHNSFRFS